jgi:hypothetical protein
MMGSFEGWLKGLRQEEKEKSKFFGNIDLPQRSTVCSIPSMEEVHRMSKVAVGSVVDLPRLLTEGFGDISYRPHTV